MLRKFEALGGRSYANTVANVSRTSSGAWALTLESDHAPVVAKATVFANGGYGAQATSEELAALGVGETVMVEVSLDRHDAEVLEEFGRVMAEIPEVLEVYLMAGDYDYFVKIAANGTQGVEAFLRERLFKVAGLRHSKSSFSLRCLKKVVSFVPD